MSSNQRLAFLQEILLEETDEVHPLNASQIIEFLTQQGIHVERKTIYRDIAVLRTRGLHVEKNGKGYFVANRLFQYVELRLLSDCLIGAPFLTQKKTDELLKKLGKLTNRFESKKLQSLAAFAHPDKSRNESIYYVLDALQRAIETQKMVRFSYRQDTLASQDASRNNKLEVSPYALFFRGDQYVLIGNDSRYDRLSHFHIDHIKDVLVKRKQSRPLRDVSACEIISDLAGYAYCCMDIFGRKDAELIRLRCRNDLYPHMKIAFAQELSITQKSQTHFVLNLNASPTQDLMHYLAQFGHNVEVLAPSHMRLSMYEFFRDSARVYTRPLPDRLKKR